MKKTQLYDLPIEMVDKILQKLDPVSRIVTRHVSESLQPIVDNLKPNFKKLYVSMNGHCISFGLDQENIWYFDYGNSCQIRYGVRELVIKEGRRLNLALKDFKSLTENKKLKLDQLYFCINIDDHWICFLPDSQISIRKLIIHTRQLEFLSLILPQMKPGTLESIECENENKNILVSVRELASMKQWKQLKNIYFIKCGCIESAELKQFYHFTDFSVKINCLPIGELLSLRDNLLRSIAFKRCKIEFQSGIVDLFSLATGFPEAVGSNRSLRIPIPGSKSRLDFTVIENYLIIVKETPSHSESDGEFIIFIVFAALILMFIYSHLPEPVQNFLGHFLEYFKDVR